MAGQREPNHLLEAVFAETGFSALGLARRINDLARQTGVKASATDHTSIHRWLSGQRPRPHTLRLLCAVFSQALGRPITESDLGYAPAGADSDTGLIYHQDLAAAVVASTELYRSDVRRRRFLTDAAVTSTAFAVPAVRYLTAPQAPLPARETGRRIGTAEVEAVREITATFRRLDNKFGGGYGRSSVVHYLLDEVAPMLKTASYTPGIGASLFSAVSELTLLAGWMAYDLEQHPVAQRYLIQALNLAQISGDDALGAEILAGMSHQAAYLGQSDDAVDMARAAGHCARRAGQPVLIAEAHAAEAHGHALAGNRRSAVASLIAAEHALAGADHASTPAWLVYFDEAYLAAKSGHALREAGDPAQAVVQAERSLAMQDGYARGRVFNLVLLATAYVEHGDIEQAADTGIQAVQAARSMSSARTLNYLRDLRRRLAPYHRQPTVSSFDYQAAALVSAPPAALALPAGR
jgi:hypothetical protein